MPEKKEITASKWGTIDGANLYADLEDISVSAEFSGQVVVSGRKEALLRLAKAINDTFGVA